MRFGVRQHARPESISKRAPSTTRTSPFLATNGLWSSAPKIRLVSDGLRCRRHPQSRDGRRGSMWNAAAQETAACFRTCAQRSSLHTTATTFVSGRSATSPDGCIKRVLRALIEERRRSRKPSPCLAFLPLSEPTERKRVVCAQKCAHAGVPKRLGCRRYQPLSWLYLASKTTVRTRVAFTASLSERFRVSVFVSYTCRCAVRWPRG